MSEAQAEWVRCRPWIEAALAHDGGLHGIEDIEACIASGEAHFWPGKQSAMVTQFWAFPRAKAINVWLAGGDMDEIVLRMRPAVEDWAKARGCTHFVIAGRPGWARVLKEFDFHPWWTALGKELT